MKKLLLMVVAGFAVLAGSQLQARKVCDMVLKSEGFTVEGESFKCKDVSCPPCMCEAPKKVECNCTPSITVDESCHEVCHSCRQLKSECGCHKHNGGRRSRHRHAEAEVIMED